MISLLRCSGALKRLTITFCVVIIAVLAFNETRAQAHCALYPTTFTTNTKPNSCSYTCDGKLKVIPQQTGRTVKKLVVNPLPGTLGGVKTVLTDSVTGLCQGLYTVVVTYSTPGGDCSSLPISFAITTTNATACDTCKALSVTYSKTPCDKGFANGSITLGITGGQGPFKVQWSRGDTTRNISGCTPGMYYFSLLDSATKCSWRDSVRIIERDTNCVIPGEVEVVHTSCLEACDGKVSFKSTVNLPPPITVVATKVLADASGVVPILDSLCVGTYNIQLIDAYGCKINKAVEVKPGSAHCDTCDALEASAKYTIVSQQYGCDATVKVNVSGGSGHYTYTWSPNPAHLSAQGDSAWDVCPGSYSVLIKDLVTGCSTTVRVDIPDFYPGGECDSLLVDAFRVKNSTTATSCDGRADVSISKGSGNYTVIWSNGKTSQVNDNICNGLYIVSVYDNVSGCLRRDTVILSSCESLKIDARTVSGNTGTLPTCNGVATVDVTGGSGDYVFAWTNGETTQTVNNLCSGRYDVVVTDKRTGCVRTDSVVTGWGGEPANPCSNGSSINAYAIVGFSEPINCTGSATVQVSGGSGNYAYIWSNGSTTKDVSSLCPGRYRVRVFDLNNFCVLTDTVEIFRKPTNDSCITAGLAIKNPNCVTASNGKLTATVYNATQAPYKFEWSNGTIDFGVNSSINNQSVGSYSVRITDKNGCSILLAGILIPGSSDCSYSCEVNPIPTATLCPDSCNGSITLNPVGTSGGNAVWSNANVGLQNNSLCVGTYAYTYTAPNGCTATGSASVSYLNKVCPSCNLGASVQVTPGNAPNACSASAKVTVSGGVGPFLYIWSGSTSTTNVATDLCAVLQSVKIIDQGKNCDTTLYFTPTLNTICNTPVNATSTSTNSDVAPNCNGTAQIFATGGTGAGFSYTWTGPTVVPDGPTGSGLCPIVPYTVTIRDLQNPLCSTSVVVTIGTRICETPVIITKKVVQSHATTCDGSIELTVSGGTGAGYTYFWPTIAGANGPTVTNLCANGIYPVTVTDKGDALCVAEETIILGTKQDPSDTCILALEYDTTNASTTTACDGSAMVIVTKGSGHYAYVWDNNPSTTETATGLCPGDYTVTVTDLDSNCSQKITIPVKGNPGNDGTPCFLHASVSVTTPTATSPCSAVATANVSGTGPFSYEWDLVASTSNQKSGLCAGTVHTIRIMDQSKQCDTTFTFTVPVIPGPCDLDADYTSTNSATASSCDGSGDVTVTGGSGNFTYSWEDNPSTTSHADHLCPGDYLVTIIDTTRGCTTYVTVTVGTTEKVPCFVTANVEVTPGTGPNPCSASAKVTLTSASAGPFTYQWSFTTSTSNQVYNVCPQEDYWVKIYDVTKECDTTIYFDVPAPGCTVRATATTKSSFPAPNCGGEIHVAPTGGSGSYTYRWTGPTPNGNSPDLTGACPGVYIIKVMDAQDTNCFYIITETIGVTTCELDVKKIVVPSHINPCDGSIELTVTGASSAGYTITWTTIPNANGANKVTGLCPGAYPVTVRDNGDPTCAFSEIITVGTDVPPPCPLKLTYDSTNCTSLQPCNGTATVYVSGGSTHYTYTWTNNVSTTNQATGLCPGDYTVVVYDTDNHCSDSVKIRIGATDLPPCNITYTLDTVHPSITTPPLCNGRITVNVSPANPNYTYTWTGSASTTNTASNLCPGHYTVKVTDPVSGCDTLIEVDFPLPCGDSLQVKLDTINASCATICDGRATVSVINGSGDYSYTWSTGDYGAVDHIESLCAGKTYTVTVIDNGRMQNAAPSEVSKPCYSRTLTFTLGAITRECPSSCEYPSKGGDCCPLVITVRGSRASCPAAKDGRVNVSVSGGVAPYQVTWSNGSGNYDQLVTAGYYTVVATDAIGNSITAGISVGTKDIQCGAEAAANKNPQSIQTSAGPQPLPLLMSYILPGFDLPYVPLPVTVGCDEFISLEAIQPVCLNSTEGKIRVNYTAGGSNPQYLWSDTETSNVRSNLGPGTYAGTATDDTPGCQGRFNVILTPACKTVCDTGCHLVVVKTTQAPSDPDLCDGTVTVTVTGGSDNYKYEWTGSHSTTNTANDLCSYATVKITDLGKPDCDTTIIIDNRPCLSVTLDTTNVSCMSICDGTVTAKVANGTGNFLYTWSTGDYGGQEVERIQSLCANGTYTVTVVDLGRMANAPNVETANEACYSATASITMAASTNPCPTDCAKPGNSEQRTNCCPLKIDISGTSASCPTNKDGQILCTAGGGVAPYQYKWSNGSGNQNQYVTPGYYTVVVTDARGNTISAGISIGSKSLNCADGPYSQYVQLQFTTVPVAKLVEELFPAIDVPEITVSYDRRCNEAISLSAIQPTCLNAKDGDIAVSYFAVGSSNVSYQWTDGVTDNNRPNVGGGYYKGIAIAGDAVNGCQANFEVNLVPACGPCADTPCILVVQADSTPSTSTTSCDGTAKVTVVSGGSGHYSYTWTGSSSTTNLATGLCPGTYTVHIQDTDNPACDTNITISVGVACEPLEVALDTVNASCASVCDGRAAVQVMNGSGDYSYSWSTGDYGKTDHIESLCNGESYTVTIIDNGRMRNAPASEVNNPCYSKTIRFTLGIVDRECPTSCSNPSTNGSDCCPMRITVAGSSASCPTAKDGRLSVGVGGGVAPYQVKWSNGSGNYDQLVTPGDYTVTATDATGNSITAGVSVGMRDQQCSDASASVQSGQSIQTVEGPQPVPLVMNYVVPGFDLPYVPLPVTGGCEQKTLIDAIQPSCLNSADGMVRVDYSTPNGNSQYLWSDGITNPYRPNIPAGTYAGTATDGTIGCQGRYNVVLTPACKTVCAQACSLAVTTSTTPSHGDVCDGTATVNVSGGTGPYSYTWSGTTSTTNSATNLCEGDYSVYIQDQGNPECDTIIFIKIRPCLTVRIDTINAACATLCNGEAKAIVSGGVGNFLYIWSTGDYGGSEVSRIQSLCPGQTYTVTVVDQDRLAGAPSIEVLNEACYSVTASITMAVPENACPKDCQKPGGDENERTDCCPLAVAINGRSASCPNAKDARIGAYANGGVAPYQYKWSNGSGNQNQFVTPGYYTVTVTDAKGNSMTAGFSIGSKSLNCADGDAGGPQNRSQKSNSTGISVNQLVKELAPGVSIPDVGITVDKACDEAIQLTAIQPTCLTATDGQMAVDYVTANSSSTTYLWNDLSTDNARPNVGAGMYKGTATANDGVQTCTAQYEVSMIPSCGPCDAEPLPCVFVVTVDTTAASSGSNCNGKATINVDPISTGNSYTYTWPNNESTTNTATHLCPGTYTVKISTNDSERPCDTTITIVIRNAGDTCLKVSVDNHAQSCSNICDGYAVVHVSNGSGNYTYGWSTGDYGNDVDTIESLCPGSYTVSVVDRTKMASATNLSDVQKTCYSANYNFTIAASTVKCDSICDDTTAQKGCCPLKLKVSSSSATCATAKDGQLHIQADGGVAPYSYKWSNGSGNRNQLVGPGEYTCLVTDARGNTISCGISVGATSIECPPFEITNTIGLLTETQPLSEVFEILQPNVDFPGTVGQVTEECATELYMELEQPTCLGESNGRIKVNYKLNGDTTNITYFWTDGGSTVSERKNLLPGSYVAIASGKNGRCAGRFSADLMPSCRAVCCDAIKASYKIIEAPCRGVCNGIVSVTASGGVAPYTYKWKDGSTNDTTFQACAGYVSVQITDATGCTRLDSIKLNAVDRYSIMIDATGAYCLGQCDGSATVSTNGGNSPFTYLWSNGATTQTIEGLCAYSEPSVTVTDAIGCQVSGHTKIANLHPFYREGKVSPPSCESASDGYINVKSISGGQAPYTWKFYKLVNNQYVEFAHDVDSVGGLPNGYYRLIAYDSQGCYFEWGWHFQTLIGLNSTIKRPECPEMCTGAIVIGPSDPEEEFTYVWEDGSTNDTITNLCAGNHYVDITDERGCVVRKTFTLVNKFVTCCDRVQAEGTYKICQGEKVQIRVTGGYEYEWSPQESLNDPYIQDPIANPAVTTDYHVLVRAEYCPYRVERVVTVHVAKPIPLSAYTDRNICGPDSVLLGFTTTEGNLIKNISWTPAVTIACASCQETKAKANTSTTYKVTVTGEYNCTYSDTVRINVGGSPSGVMKPNFTTCKGTEITLQAYGGGSYCWSANSPECIGTTASIKVTPEVTTTYKVRVITVEGCVRDYDVVVTVIKAPVLDAHITELYCDGEGTVTASGADSYTWSPAKPYVDCPTCQTTTIHPPKSPYTYYVYGKVKDCVAKDSVVVDYDVFQNVSAKHTFENCIQHFEVVNGKAGMSYEWNFGDGSPRETGANVTHRYDNSGTYTIYLYVTDPECGTRTIQLTFTQDVGACNCVSDHD